MSNNPDNNSQVSPDPEGSNPVQGDAASIDVNNHETDPSPDLAALLKRAEDEAAELKDAWLRAKAETDNVRKHAQNDVAKAHKYAVERFAQELLTVKDSLELTLATPNATTEAAEGRGRADAEESQCGVRESADRPRSIRCSEKYDPHRHQAMTMIESDEPPGTVVQVFQKGYLLNDRVLRPALVAVAKAEGIRPRRRELITRFSP